MMPNCNMASGGKMPPDKMPSGMPPAKMPPDNMPAGGKDNMDQSSVPNGGHNVIGSKHVGGKKQN